MDGSCRLLRLMFSSLGSRYFYTQFIGDVNDIPIIRGSANFSGIALIDTDVYIPGGSGAEWYVGSDEE